MLKRMARQDRMALLDIDLNLFLQPEILQKAVNRRHIVIILVLRRLLRLRFDQDRTFVADFVLILDDRLQEAASMGAFGFQIGVEQSFVALTPAPQHIVRATEFMRGIETGFHRRRRIGVNFGVRVGGSPRHPALMAEHIGGAPEQLGLVRRLLFAKVINDFLKVAQAFGKGRALGPRIGIVEGVERRAQDIEHLKRHIGL